MIIRKIILAFILFIFASSAHAKTYTSEANDCLTRPDINGTLVVHLNSVRSGFFSHTNNCWYMASGDIKPQNYQGTLVAIATWVPLAYIDFEPDFSQYPKPDRLKPNTWLHGFLVFTYYEQSRDYFCKNSMTSCAAIQKFTPSMTMSVKQLKDIAGYYSCYPTNTDYPDIGDANCKLDKQYYIENGKIKHCSSNPEHTSCNNGNNDNNGNNGNNGNNNNNGNNDVNNSENVHLSDINDELIVISESLNTINTDVSKVAGNSDLILSSVESIKQTTNDIANNTDDIGETVDELLKGQIKINENLSKIASTDVVLLSETKSFHSDVNKNHDALMNKLDSIENGNGNGSGNDGIGDFNEANANSLNDKFNDSASDYEDKSLSYVESALSKLTNNIPDLTLMFKLPSSFYGGNNGVCKPLSSKLDFDFPFYSKKFILKFDTSDFCQHYDKNFRGIVDFMLAFMTALAIFRLYHRYNSSH